MLTPSGAMVALIVCGIGRLQPFLNVPLGSRQQGVGPVAALAGDDEVFHAVGQARFAGDAPHGDGVDQAVLGDGVGQPLQLLDVPPQRGVRPFGPASLLPGNHRAGRGQLARLHLLGQIGREQLAGLVGVGQDADQLERREDAGPLAKFGLGLARS